MQAGVIIAIIFAIIVSVFALQNAQPVDIKFLTMEGEASLALVILLSVALGAAILALLNLYSRFRTGRNMKKLSKEKDALGVENSELQLQINALQQEKAVLEERLATTEEQLANNQQQPELLEAPEPEQEYGTDINPPQY